MSERATTRYGGPDWATDKHAVCIVDGIAVVLHEFVIAHTAARLSG